MTIRQVLIRIEVDPAQHNHGDTPAGAIALCGAGMHAYAHTIGITKATISCEEGTRVWPFADDAAPDTLTDIPVEVHDDDGEA